MHVWLTIRRTSTESFTHSAIRLRRAIMEKLSGGRDLGLMLAEPLDVTLAAVVQHLQVLEESGLVHTEKIGRVRTCRIDPKGLDAVQQWIDDRRSVWEKRFGRLGDLLAEPEERQGE